MSPHQKSYRETIIPKSAFSRFFALMNDCVQSDTSLGYIPFQMDAFRKEYMHYGYDVHHDAITTHRATISGPSSAIRYHLPRSNCHSESIDRDDAHSDSHQASTPRGDNRVILGRISDGKKFRVEHTTVDYLIRTCNDHVSRNGRPFLLSRYQTRAAQRKSFTCPLGEKAPARERATSLRDATS